MLLAVEVVVDHHDQSQKYAGDDACEQSLTHGDLSNGSGNDHQNGRRDHRGQHGTCQSRTPCVGAGVAGTDHGVGAQSADGGHVGNGRTAHAGEENRSHNIHVAKTAMDPANDIFTERKNLLGNAALIHQDAGQEKQGNSHHGEAVHGGIHQLDGRCNRRGVIHQNGAQRGHAQRDGHGDAKEHQNKEYT